MLHPAPLLALDWIQIAILLFIVISSLASQLFKTNQDRQRKAGQRPGGPRPGPPEAQPPKPDRPRGALQEEIETFLQRAAGQEAAQAADVVAAEVVPEQVVAEVTRPKPARLTAPARPIGEVTVHETVAEHVARHLQHAPTGLERRDAHLGSRIEQADELMESRLEQRFDHALGRLAPTSTEGPDQAARSSKAAVLQTSLRGGGSISASDLAQLLRSPQEFANAIVLSEILKRPVDRWS